MTIQKKVMPVQGHYGLEFVLANSQATILEVISLLAKRNRVKKSERKPLITPKEKTQLQSQLEQRSKIRRSRENGRRANCFK